MAGDSSPARGAGRSGLGLLALGLGGAMALALISIQIPLGRDQGVAAYGAALIARGKAPYADYFYFNLPGNFFFYYLAGLLPLGVEQSVNLLDQLSIAVTALLVYASGREIGSGARGAAAATIYAWYAVVFEHRYWEMAQKEGLASMFLALAVWSLLRLKRADRSGESVLVLAALALGAGSGLAAQFKPSLGILLLALPYGAWRGSDRLRDWARLIAVGLLGFGISFVPLTGYLLGKGALGQMIEQVLRFGRFYGSLGYGHGPHSGPAKGALVVMIWAIARFALMGWAAGGAVKGRRHPQGRVLILATLLLGLQVVVQMKFFFYHLIPLLVPFALLAEFGVEGFIRRVKEFKARDQASWRRLVPAPAALVVLTFALNLAPALGRYGDEIRYDLGLLDRPTFYQSLGRSGGDLSLESSAQVAQYLHRHTRPGDPILVYGLEPGLYVQSGRFAPTRFAYDLPLSLDPGDDEDFRRYQQELRQVFLADLRAHPPVYIVVNERDRNPTEPRDSWTQLQAFTGLKRLLDSEYRLEIRLGYFRLYRRVDGFAFPPPP